MTLRPLAPFAGSKWSPRLWDQHSRILAPCLSCGGSGELLVWVSDAAAWAPESCPECQGAGTDFEAHAVDSYYDPTPGSGGGLARVLNAGLLRNGGTLYLGDQGPIRQLWWDVVFAIGYIERGLRLLRDKCTASNLDLFVEAKRELNSTVTATDRSACVLILLHGCHNGTWRVNKKGQFNVPRGGSGARSKGTFKPKLIDVGDIIDRVREWHDGLSRYLIRFDDMTEDPCQLKAELVWFDPPYHKTGIRYAVGGFSDMDQRHLREDASEHANRGARVFVSNSDTQLIRELYSGSVIHELHRNGNYGVDGSNRGPVTELMIEVKA